MNNSETNFVWEVTAQRDLSAFQAGQMRNFRTPSAAWLSGEERVGLLVQELPWGFSRRAVKPSDKEPVTRRGEMAAYARGAAWDRWGVGELATLAGVRGAPHGVDIVVRWTQPIASTR